MVLDDTLKNYFSSAAGASADHTTALRAPPQRGATMNTQRSLRACSGGGVAAEEHCRSAAKKCQNHCSDALGDVLSHNINN